VKKSYAQICGEERAVEELWRRGRWRTRNVEDAWDFDRPTAQLRESAWHFDKANSATLGSS
jgi:hypothetical protein